MGYSSSSDTVTLIHQILSRATGGSDLELPALFPVEGGSINATYQIITKDNRQWFCKINDGSRLPDLLAKEKRGLDLLREQNIFRIPAVVAIETAGSLQVLILEWIGSESRDAQPAGQATNGRDTDSTDSAGTGIRFNKEEMADTDTGSTSLADTGIRPGMEATAGTKTRRFWSLFGEQLARLHHVSAPTFGLDHDNYIGSLPQKNTHSPVWSNFFIQQRLEPQVRLAGEKGLLSPSAIRQFEQLYQVLPELFPPEVPSLLHGDLWSGNFLCDEKGNPVLIDPAVYFGHRSMDLAMTTLFGGFGQPFYEAYHYHFPLPANYRQQWEIANLYPLLVHLNLFGESYTGSILHTIQRF